MSFHASLGFRKNIIFIFVTAIFLGPPALCQAAVTKNLQFTWSYDTSQPGLAGYRIYLDNIMIGQVNDPHLMTMEISVDLEGGSNFFTMTAFSLTGFESDHSQPFEVNLPPTDPVGNMVPVASFLASTEKGEAPLVVDFSAEASSDLDGSIVDYAWEFGDGGVDNGVTTSHIYQTAGSYVANLTVTDNEGATATTATTITVSPQGIPANIPPVAEIISEAKSDTPFAVGFDGSRSSDSDGEIVNYVWDFGDGVSGFGKYSEHVFSTYGSYLVSLEVTDDRGATDRTQATITLIDPAISFYAINFQPDFAPVPEGFQPDYGEAYNPERGYGWSELPYNNLIERNSRRSVNKAYDTLIFVKPTSVWEMEVVDGDYLVTVCMGDPKHPRGRQSMQVEDEIVFDREALNSSNRWIEQQIPVTVRDGLLTVTFAGSDDPARLSWLIVEKSAEQQRGNLPPQSVITVEGNNQEAPLDVTFDGRKSSDPDGSIVSYHWNFGDGSISEEALVQHIYNTPGNYTAFLEVTDDEGASATTQTSIVVKEPVINQAPVALDSTLLVAEDSGANPGNLKALDPEGAPLTYSLLSNGQRGKVTLLNSNTGSFIYTPNTNANGDDQFTFMVSDGAIQSNEATVKVTISPINDSPIAKADSVTSEINVAVSIDVMANDSDVDGDILSIARTSQPAHGSVTVSNHQVVYFPEADFSGQDSFSYTISDGRGGEATAEVAVNILPADLSSSRQRHNQRWGRRR